MNEQPFDYGEYHAPTHWWMFVWLILWTVAFLFMVAAAFSYAFDGVDNWLMTGCLGSFSGLTFLKVKEYYGLVRFAEKQRKQKRNRLSRENFR